MDRGVSTIAPAFGLEPWIAPRHLIAAAVSGHPEDPLAGSWVDGFLIQRVADDLAEFVERRARTEPLYRLYSEPTPVSSSRWALAGEADRFARVVSVAGSGDEPTSDAALGYVRAAQMFRSEPFHDLVGRLCEWPIGSLHELTTWSMGPGDFVRPHQYDAGTCGVRTELWLSTGWSEGSGGALCIADDRERVRRIPFRHNTLVLLRPRRDVTFWVAPIRPSATPTRRVSVIACFDRVGEPQDGNPARRSP